jgi:hypothetical protein
MERREAEEGIGPGVLEEKNNRQEGWVLGRREEEKEVDPVIRRGDAEEGIGPSV